MMQVRILPWVPSYENVANNYDNVVVCCPEGFFRKGNVDIFCEFSGINMVDSLDDLVAYIRDSIKHIK